ncbi:MAG: hypothetical protein ACR2L6_11550 [Gemmatimonadaceae bacterium]
MRDTDPATFERYLAVIRTVPPAERFVRALALSALARDLAREGAARHSAHLGDNAVAERFLLQMYGPDVAARMTAMLRSGTSIAPPPHE